MQLVQIIYLHQIIALQNNALSLFKNTAYYIEDQLIEYCDYPAQAYLVKNLSEFSKQYAKSAGTNQQFYLDTEDGPTTPYNNVRFFVDGGVNDGLEAFFTVNGAGSVVPQAPIANGDAIIAKSGNLSIQFVSYTAAGALLLRTLVIDGGLLALDDAAGSVDNSQIYGVVSSTGVKINFLSNFLPVNPLQNGATGAIRPIDGLGTNGNILTASVIFPKTFNKGYYERQKLVDSVKFGENNLICARIPLKDMFLFCRGYDKISRGLRHRVVLNRQDDNQMLYRYRGADRYVQIKYISMWIPTVKPDLNTLKMIESKLTSNDLYTVNFTDLNCWRTPNVQIGPANQAAIQLSNTTKKPIRVWVCFQSVERTQASQTVNKMVFEHLFTTNIQVRLNGRIFPMYEYKFNYDGNNNIWTGYHRAYTALMNSGYKMHDYSDGSLLDVETFAKLYPIFYFDLTAQEEDLFKANKYAELEVRWSNFADVVAPNGYHMYVVYECERIIKFKGVSGTMALEL